MANKRKICEPVHALEPPPRKKATGPKQSQEERALQVKEDVQLMQQKIQDHLACGGTWEHLKPNSRFHKGIIEMQCAVCQEFFPRTTEFFSMSLKNRKHLTTSQPGREILLNSKSTPCKMCRAKAGKAYRNTPKGYATNLTCKAIYPQLNHSWVFRQVSRQNNVGYYTGFPLTLASGDWQASIHNLVPAQKDHRPENCVLDIFELNINQGGSSGAIPDLGVAIDALFKAFLANYGAPPLPGDTWLHALSQTPQEMGITGSRTNQKEYQKQCSEKHLPRILSIMITNHHRNDKIKKRDLNWRPLTREENRKLERDVVEKLIAQGCRCAYSHVPLTWTNGWQRLSFERLDNSRPHFENRGLDNVVFICRSLNGPAQMSRAKMLELMLGQTKVPVPPDMRLAIEAELTQIKSQH